MSKEFRRVTDPTVEKLLDLKLLQGQGTKSWFHLGQRAFSQWCYQVRSGQVRCRAPYFQQIPGYQWIWRGAFCLFWGKTRIPHSWMICS